MAQGRILFFSSLLGRAGDGVPGSLVLIGSHSATKWLSDLFICVNDPGSGA